MKKRYLVLVSMLLVLIGVLLGPTIAFAMPFETVTLGPNSELVPTQQVYKAKNKIVVPYEEDKEKSSIDLQDMTIDEKDGFIYIVDNGNNKIIRTKLDGSEAIYLTNTGIKDRNFDEPTGVALNDEYLLVADKGLHEVLVYEKSTLNFIKSIVRPSDTLIGKEQKFNPTKVQIDKRNNIYLISEGNKKGVMQLTLDGEFMGYIGANETNKSFFKWMRDLLNFKTNEGMDASGDAVTNIALDSNGLLYTVTKGSESNAIKKLNTSGVSIMSPQVNYKSTLQISVDNSGNIYSVRDDGYITILDSYGNLLFTFGGTNNKGEELLGSLETPISIKVNSDHSIMVLDKAKQIIINYETTEFSKLVYKAVDYYKDGLYLEGEELWSEVLKHNSKFILAYKALAKANMKRGDYNTALNQFKLAEDKKGYSEAYWEIRDVWLRANLAYILIPLIVVVIAYAIIRTIDIKKPAVFAGVKAKLGIVNNAPLVGDITFMKNYFLHTRDAVYEMKYKGKSNVISATILYILFVAIQIAQVYIKGYLFNTTNVYNENALEIILFSTLPLLLLVVCNYFVSTVTDGEGKFKQVYIGFIYSLTPYLIFAIPLFLLSNVLTYNEQIIYTFLEVLIYGWCAINIVLTIMELHDYSFWKAIKNILLTLVSFILAIAFAFIIYMLGYQLVTYIVSVIKELAV